MTRIRSVQEIQNIQVSNNTADKLARRYLVRRVDELIRNGAKEQLDAITFEVPCMIVFVPMYNRDVLTRALCKHYSKIGFDCQVNDYALTIGWGGESDEQSTTTEVSNEEAEPISDEDNQPLAMKFSIDRPSMAKRVADMKQL